MEIHSVLPEERARTEKGEYLPWGYKYADSSKNTRLPEESGPFGRNRSIRYTSSAGRRASTRAGTTPVRQKQENSAISEFSRLFAKEQQQNTPTTSNVADNNPSSDLPSTTTASEPTECLLYGYTSKSREWNVLQRYESVVAPSTIVEDYPRSDPTLFLNTNSPLGASRSSLTGHRNLSKAAIEKSMTYRGGQHWIKITFDSYEAAEKACFYSPLDIDGCSVYCEMWQGRPPITDAAIPKSATEIGGMLSASKARTVGVAGGKSSAIAGFEQALQTATLPRNMALPDAQYSQPRRTRGELQAPATAASSDTASSATAMSPPPGNGSEVRSRSVPSLPSQAISKSTSTQMTHIPSVRKAVLRPVTEALPPQQSALERFVLLIGLAWLFGIATSSAGGAGTVAVVNPELASGGPIVKDDGSWDTEKNGLYWKFWYSVDRLLGTDYCGLKED